MDLTLGVVAHRGGLLVRQPELTVGVVAAVARPSGLRLELIARRPVDRRDASERQRDIRLGRDPSVTVPPRVLLPEYDEGQDLRLGWLDKEKRARWEYPSSLSSSSGDHYEGFTGPSWRLAYDLPPLFDEVSIVLAWPEIGFGESVVTIALPDQVAVERATTSIWEAPFESLPVPELSHHTADHHDPMQPETGTVIATPRVLHRNDHAVVVLNRLTAVGSALSLELLGVVTGPRAKGIIRDRVSRSQRPPQLRSRLGLRPGALSLAVILGDDAFWIPLHEAVAYGGDHQFTTMQELVFDRPAGDVLDLLVSWPAAELPDARVRVSLDG